MKWHSARGVQVKARAAGMQPRGVVTSATDASLKHFGKGFNASHLHQRAAFRHLIQDPLSGWRAARGQCRMRNRLRPAVTSNRAGKPSASHRKAVIQIRENPSSDSEEGEILLQGLALLVLLQ